MGNVQNSQYSEIENLVSVQISKGIINYLRIHHYPWLAGIAAEMVINGNSIDNTSNITGVSREEICKLVNIKH